QPAVLGVVGVLGAGAVSGVQQRPLAELVVVQPLQVLVRERALDAGGGVDLPAAVVAVGQHLPVGVRQLQHPVPAVVPVLRGERLDVAALGRRGAGLLGDLAERAVLAGQGAGAVGDVGDPAGGVVRGAGRTVGVGDVVRGEDRVADRGQPGEVVVV